MAETERFQIAMDHQGDILSARVSGRLDEDARFEELLEYVAHPPAPVKAVEFDLEGVILLNSCGIRSWLFFLERLQVSKIQMRFSFVSELFVEQAGIIQNILGRSGTPVAAFEAPYFCPKCRERTLVRLKVAEISASGSFAAPPQNCGKCGSAMEFDAIADEYFYFLEHTQH